MSGYLSSLVMRTIEPVVSIRPRLTPLYGLVPEESQEPLPTPIEETKEATELPLAATTSPILPLPSPATNSAVRFDLKRDHPVDLSKPEGRLEDERFGARSVGSEHLPGAEVPTSLAAHPLKSGERPIDTAAFLEPRSDRTRPEELRTDQEGKKPKRSFTATIVENEGAPERRKKTVSPAQNTQLPMAADAKAIAPQANPSLQVQNQVQKPSQAKSAITARPSAEETQGTIAALSFAARELRQREFLPWKPMEVSPPMPSEFRQGQQGRSFETRLAPPRQKEMMGNEPVLKPLEPTIQVTIGRVEVRAESLSLPAKKAAARTPTLSLSDYLRQRSKGSPE